MQSMRSLFTMKPSLFLLLCTIGVLFMGVAQSSAATKDLAVHTPSPGYPPDALKAKVVGAGKCVVEFGPSGHVDHATMTPSTGSKVLDDNTLNFARKNWTGHPNTKLVVPVNYQLALPTRHTKFVVRVTGLKPPYPVEAMARGVQGSGMLKVSFDEKGKLMCAIMVQSTGSKILDDNTIKYVTNEWFSSGGRKTTMLVPITYKMQ